jgi:hypothetical protein
MVFIYLSEKSISYALLILASSLLVLRISCKVLLVTSIISLTWLLIALTSSVSSRRPAIELIMQILYPWSINISFQIEEMEKGGIVVASRYRGALWAAKILEDWGEQVSIGAPSAGAKLIILDELQEKEYASYVVDKIIVKDVSMGPQHALALSGVLVTFGQQNEFFFPKYLVESTVSNGLAILALQMLL